MLELPGPEARSGELLPRDTFTAIAKPHPLRADVVHTEFQAGLSLTEALGERACVAAQVSIGGIAVPRAMWSHCRPKAGTHVLVVLFPRGHAVKKVLQVVVAVVLIAVGVFTGNLQLVTMGISMLVSAIVSALIPPPKAPKIGGGDTFNRLNSITGTSNNAAPYGPIPCVIGEARFFPPYAALPYTEILGDDQYLRMLLDLGYGDLDISAIKIGQTDLSSFTDVQTQISVTPSLFSDDIYEDPVGTTFNDGAVTTRTGQALSDELSVDVFFQNGLFGVDSKGKSLAATASVKVEYSPTGAGTWTNVATLSSSNRTISNNAMSVSGSNFLVTSSARKTLRCGLSWKVASGQYDVRLTRNTTSWGSAVSDGRVGDAVWTVLRSIRYTLPSTTGTLKLALKIKATDQLNGVINQLSLLAKQKVAVYNSGTSTWAAPAPNTNPAWVYYWLLNACPGMAKTVAASRIDLTRISAWADDCTSKNFTCKGVVDTVVRAFDLLRDVLASGAASFAMRDGKYSALMDQPQTVPIQHFTPANSKDFSVSRTFIDLPHALRVQFINPTSWQPDELIVLDDLHSYNGFNARGVASGLPAASKFETMTLRYVTGPEAAWRLGRLQLAQGTYRPNVFAWTTDIEHLVCTRGDLVLLAHDVIEWGTAWGRIKALTIVSSHATQITLDGVTTLAPATSYSVRVRLQDGSSLISAITTAAGDVTVIDLATPMAGLNIGDLFMLGITGNDTQRLLVTAIKPNNELGAVLTAVEYNDSIYTYIASPPSTFISGNTGLPFLPPPPPVITVNDPGQVAAPPSDGGNTSPTIGVGVQPASGYGLPNKYQLQ